MQKKETIRYAHHPDDFKHYTTDKLRNEFLIETLFEENTVIFEYSHYDRMVIGGILPVAEELKLPALTLEKNNHFGELRETGIINVGNTGYILADNERYELKNREALYLGRGVEKVMFGSNDASSPAKFYLNSALAHSSKPNKKVTKAETKIQHLGDQKNANIRDLNQYIVPGIVDTCQLMMGITDCYPGNVWNTMPCHTHELRMEAYFYFDAPEGNSMCHIMGEPKENRLIWVNNEQAVISPPWSIHTAAGTSHYSFIWGMAGSDSEMDGVKKTELR